MMKVSGLVIELNELLWWIGFISYVCRGDSGGWRKEKVEGGGQKVDLSTTVFTALCSFTVHWQEQ